MNNLKEELSFCGKKVNILNVHNRNLSRIIDDFYSFTQKKVNINKYRFYTESVGNPDPDPDYTENIHIDHADHSDSNSGYTEGPTEYADN